MSCCSSCCSRLQAGRVGWAPLELRSTAHYLLPGNHFTALSPRLPCPLRRGAGTTVRDATFKRTPLHFAALADAEPVARLLLQVGACLGCWVWQG